MTSITSVKATPLISSELERVRAEFRFFSPAGVPYDKARLPRVGEIWSLERTLPSGLVLGINWTKWEEAVDAVRYLLRLPGKRFNRGYDFRKLQYRPEQQLKEHPLLNIMQWETSALSWHPTKKLLVTAGIGNYAKLWDVTNGNMITESPIWDSGEYTGSAAARVLTWSYDGKIFISFGNSYDGDTGEHLINNLLPSSSWYTNDRYGSLRGHYIGADYSAPSPFSSSGNFSPWRPYSEQFLNGHGEEHLVLRNRVTGNIEKGIACDVPSPIRDFAWHPKGRFIAVSFDRHNIRIIDLDEARIVDDLSVQHIVGWSPDGKVLVARQEFGTDDFVIWIGPDGRQQPMPEEMKQEVWFKRFSKNISADGLRYFRIAHDDRGSYSPNIYSVKSDELLATLPKSVTSAAWCPTDGALLATCYKNETYLWRV